MISAEEFDLLPMEASQGFELFDGELVPVSTVTPIHSDILVALMASIRTYLLTRGRGRVWARTEFAFSRNRFQPDLAVFLDDRWKPHTTRVPVPIVPDIAVEVVSLNVSAFNIEKKRCSYLRHGVKEVWIAYPDEPHIVVYSPAGMTVVEMPGSLTTPLLPEWSQPLLEIFSICE